MAFIEDYKFWLAGIAIFLTFYAYIPYLIGIFKGKTKPHLFTWLIWSTVTAIAVVVQVIEGGGMGSWPTIAAAVTCFFITILAIKYGSKDIKKVDYIFLLASLSAIPLWLITNNPVYSAVLVTIIEIVAAFPTIRKSWHRPGEEVTSTYGLNTLRYFLSILALATFSVSTVAYPVGMVFMNGLIFIVLIIRQDKKQPSLSD